MRLRHQHRVQRDYCSRGDLPGSSRQGLAEGIAERKGRQQSALLQVWRIGLHDACMYKQHVCKFTQNEQESVARVML